MGKNNAGTDWGQFGQSNRTQVSGVTYHYGVIPASDVLQAWADSSTAIYPDFDAESYDADNVCDICELTFAEHDAGAAHDFVCEHAQEVFDSCAEVLEFVLDDSEYAASQATDDSDIFITRSAFFTFSAFCSPCAPGAGYLRDSRNAEDGIRVFCFSHDWFESGIAPYAVWRVDNGTLVIPDNPHAGMLRFELRDDFADWVSKWREFNAAIVEYADKWGTKQESSAARAYVNTIESAFEKMTWCE